MVLGTSLPEFNPQKELFLQGNRSLKDKIKVITFSKKSTKQKYSKPKMLSYLEEMRKLGGIDLKSLGHRR
jgi:hypothetical protein